MNERPYRHILKHGPTCGQKRFERICLAKEGDVLIETKHRTLSSVQIEFSASIARIDNPSDHAGSVVAYGPGYQVHYPAESAPDRI